MKNAKKVNRMTAETTAYSKTLEPGKYRLQIQAGREVKNVRLKGQRNRWYELKPISKEEFHTMVMKRSDGEIATDSIIRGLPNFYTIEGPWLMMWPAASHQWTIEITTAPKVKANVA